MLIIDDIFTLIEYCTSDQEKEGRELGKKKATEVYGPMLQELEERQKKLIDEQKANSIKFESNVGFLRDQLVYYENKIEEFESKINVMAQESPIVKMLLGADKNKDDLNNNTSSAGAIVIAASGAFFCSFLEEKMARKRQHYFELEFKKDSKVWESKIKECQSKIDELYKKLLEEKRDNNDTINAVWKILQETMKKYYKVSEQYFAFKSMEKEL